MLFWLLLACIHQPVETGLASWYGPGFRGRPTASGDIFRPWKRTAAHKTMDLGTVVRVVRTDTGRSVRVLINDRGPYVDGRIIDLSRKAARKLDMVHEGVAPVELRVVGCKRGYRCD
ncbi:MAG: septal ring lytic transglycosylase RlpA family protein [Myxococcota bacterium]|jgi:rare lipoprotein A|nr:septal ring lytic transglycosylase RlpA family protein [Myxococcota bacterium]